MWLAYAAGAVYSTVEDLYRWDQALYGTAVLSEASKEKMFTPFLEGYAYGWNVRTIPAGEPEAGKKEIGHGGDGTALHPPTPPAPPAPAPHAPPSTPTAPPPHAPPPL